MLKNIVTNIVKMVYPVIVYFIITFGMSLIIRVSNLEIKTKDVILILFIEQVASLLAILWIYKIQNKSAILEKYDYKLSDLGFKNIVLILISTYFVLNTTGLIIMVLRLNELFPGYSKLSNALSNGSLIVQVASLVIMAPILEEILFRGIVYKRMREISNFYISALVSSIIWAVAHLNMVQGVTTFLFGIFLAYLYEKYKMLGVTIICHVVFNLIRAVAGQILSSSGGQPVSNVTIDTSIYLYPMIINILIVGGLVLLLYNSKFPRKQKEILEEEPTDTI